jgi:hypothetical protein
LTKGGRVWYNREKAGGGERMEERNGFRKIRCACCGNYFPEREVDYIECVYQMPIKKCPFAPTVSLPLCVKCEEKKYTRDMRREVYFYRSCKYK